jgi:DNA-directed RNA polymerase specialized sigma24 family protein
MSAPATDGLQRLAALYAKHNEPLQALIERRAGAQPATAADACAHAWAQLLAAKHVDIALPWQPLAWVTTTAMREAWRLNALEYRANPVDDSTLDRLTVNRGRAARSADELAELHARLDLVDELPERPRRFLLRLAIGYSYDEIAAAEGATHTTTCKQIARAKRLLRDIERRRGGETEPLRA